MVGLIYLQWKRKCIKPMPDHVCHLALGPHDLGHLIFIVKYKNSCISGTGVSWLMWNGIDWKLGYATLLLFLPFTSFKTLNNCYSGTGDLIDVKHNWCNWIGCLANCLDVLDNAKAALDNLWLKISFRQTRISSLMISCPRKFTSISNHDPTPTPFLAAKAKLTPEESWTCYHIARSRIHIERANGGIANTPDCICSQGSAVHIELKICITHMLVIVILE